MSKATNEFKKYLNSILNKIDDGIHEDLWSHLIKVIIEQQRLKKMDYNKIEDLVAIVNELDGEVFEQDLPEYCTFEVSTNGYYTVIQFMGMNIWNSEDDERDYYEESDSYEDMEVFLRRKLNSEISKLSKLKF